MNTSALDTKRKAWQVAEANQALPYDSTEKKIERLQDQAKARAAKEDMLEKIRAILEEARYDVKDLNLSITEFSVKVTFG